jgi:predicted S18 family serine protease
VRRWNTRICLLFALLLAGCSEPPQKEIDQAQAAIDAATTAGADRYAADEFTAATTSLQKAHDSVDQRDYRSALSYAIDARQRAAEATKQAATGKALAKRTADQLVTDCSARISQLDTDIKVAQGARIPARDLRSPRTTLADAQSALQEARSSIDAGNYAEVTTALTEVRRKLNGAIAAVDALRQRPPHRRR